MTKKDGKYARTTVSMTIPQFKDMKATAERYGLSFSSYVVQLHENNKAMQDSKKEKADD